MLLFFNFYFCNKKNLEKQCYKNLAKGNLEIKMYKNVENEENMKNLVKFW